MEDFVQAAQYLLAAAREACYEHECAGCMHRDALLAAAEQLLSDATEDAEAVAAFEAAGGGAQPDSVA